MEIGLHCKLNTKIVLANMGYVQLSIEAKLPGCTGVSIVFTPAWHPGLQGQKAWPHRGKERAQPLSLTDSLPHLGPHSLGPANLALVSPATATLSTGLLGKDNILYFFSSRKQWMQLSPQSTPPAFGLSNSPLSMCFSGVTSGICSLSKSPVSLSVSVCVSHAFILFTSSPNGLMYLILALPQS